MPKNSILYVRIISINCLNSMCLCLCLCVWYASIIFRGVIVYACKNETVFSFVFLRSINVFYRYYVCKHIIFEFLYMKEKKCGQKKDAQIIESRHIHIQNQQEKIIALDWKTYDQKCSIFQFLDKLKRNERKKRYILILSHTHTHYGTTQSPA